MRYIREERSIQLEKDAVITIGKFDGFHLGHRKLLQRAAELRGTEQQLVLFTFSRSPQMFMAGRTLSELNTHEEKLRMAEELGVDVLIEYPFTEEVMHIPAEKFLEDILCKKLCGKTIVAGPDCCFGYQRKGNVAFLREHEQEWGYRTEVVAKEEYQFLPISSTRIREALSQGHVADANRMLGYTYGYEAEVVHGKNMGKSMGFPTINQWIPENKLIPSYGVYASRVFLDGEYRSSISNVGVKPTVPGEHRAGIETYIYDYQGDLYGKSIRVELLEYIRPEKKYPSLERLIQQVERDKKEVYQYHQKRRQDH